MPSLKAQSLEEAKTIKILETVPVLPDVEYPDTRMILDVDQQKDLAAYLEQCEIDRLNLDSTSKSFKKCNKEQTEIVSWWQKPTGIVGIIATSILAGIIVGKK